MARAVIAGIMLAVVCGAGMVERRETKAGRTGVKWFGDCQKSMECMLARSVSKHSRVGTYRLGRV